LSIKAGSEEHKELFCRQFIETHEVFDPAALPWPELDAVASERLCGVPSARVVGASGKSIAPSESWLTSAITAVR